MMYLVANPLDSCPIKSHKTITDQYVRCELYPLFMRIECGVLKLVLCTIRPQTGNSFNVVPFSATKTVILFGCCVREFCDNRVVYSVIIPVEIQIV